MRFFCIVWILFSLYFICIGEAPRPVSSAKLAEVVKAAPACPVDTAELNLSLRLIDYVDFTNPNDPHDLMDEGSSKVVTTSAGSYRITAPHHHAFFSYAYKTAGPDRPVLLVIEYPDDAERITSFMTHDADREWMPHQSFSQETGYYSGGAMPLSGKMNYFTLVSWPQDNWSPLITLNWSRTDQSGAASRMWVYAVDAFSELDVLPPDPGRSRVLDAFFPLSFLSTRDYFGWKSPLAIEHLCQYFKWIGVNRVTMMVYANQSVWGSSAVIPAWDAPERMPEERGPFPSLDDMLSEFDRVGGVGFIAGIVADGMYGNVKSDGVKVVDMPPDEALEVILKGFDEFIDRYGSYTSLKGISLGSMETIGFIDLLQDKGIAEEVVAHIKTRRPDWVVQTYVGNYYLQMPYFGHKTHLPSEVKTPIFDSPEAWDVITRWETAAEKTVWDALLADLVLANWSVWNHRPSNLKRIPDLQVFEQFHPDDHRLLDVYPPQDPRQAIYFDVVRSQNVSDYADTPYASVFSTFTEGFIGLQEGLNFHYSKHWTGPDMNPAGDAQLFGFAQALAHRDRQTLSAGSWNVKYFGLDIAMRRFAKAYRSLPPVDLKTMDSPTDALVIRWVCYNGKRYVALVNRTPFEQELVLDKVSLSVPAYQLVVKMDGRTDVPVIAGQSNPAYETWIRKRILRWRNVLKELRLLNPEAAPPCYDELIKKTLAELTAGRPYAADITLAYGLLREMELRRDILTPFKLPVPRVSEAPPLTGDLDAWPDTAVDFNAEDSRWLAAHVFMPNSWSGPEDLSLRLRMAHDGDRLYMGVEVHDQRVTVDLKDSVGTDVYRPDELALLFSTQEKYLKWETQDIPLDISLKIPAPVKSPETKGIKEGFAYRTKRTPDGYIVEGSISMKELSVAPGGSVGFMVQASDVDNTKNLRRYSGWARKSTMVIPNQPNFSYWSDARNCGELQLAH